ncbi:ATP-binding protein [Kitasatospora sp. NPDC048545]|uniref:ATP-binding protein n=1 Tax=Kitasatospora sp. NPDC048545 TaxID=3157208 RepID=UPI0033CA8BDD
MTMSRGTLDGDPHRAGPALPPGGQRRRLTLAGLPKPVAHARTFTLRALDDWYAPALVPARTPDALALDALVPDARQGVAADVAADIVLLVAELVANAMLHGDGPLELVLDTAGERLRVEVSDRSPEMPAPRLPHEPALPGGHGLVIVRRIADRWGAQPHSQGKTIWAEFDVRRPGLG